MPDKNKEIPPEKSDLVVQTIPKDFYAGANPVVQFRDVEKVVEVEKEKKITPSEKQALDEDKIKTPAKLLTSKKFIFGGGLILFLLIVGGGVVYTLFFTGESSEITPPVVKLTENPPVATTTPPVATTTPPVATTTPEIPGELPIDFPSTLLGVARDFDNDNISDLAEELFSTDPANPDTDQDKYPDGHELYYLYNPAGFEPMRLVDSGLVEEYKNPIFNYRVYVPLDWAVGVVDTDYREVIFSAINGESIMIRVYDFAQDQTFSEWFYEFAPEESPGLLSDFTTAFNLIGKKRQDGLVYYFMDNNSIYVITYHPTEERTVNFKIVLDVVARSFRLDESPRQTEESEMAPGFVESDEMVSTSTEDMAEENESTTSTTSTETQDLPVEEEDSDEGFVI